MNPPTSLIHQPPQRTSLFITHQCGVSAVAQRAQMGVTDTVNFNQKGGRWIKPAVPERPVFTEEPEPVSK